MNGFQLEYVSCPATPSGLLVRQPEEDAASQAQHTGHQSDDGTLVHASVQCTDQIYVAHLSITRDLGLCTIPVPWRRCDEPLTNRLARGPRMNSVQSDSRTTAHLSEACRLGRLCGAVGRTFAVIVAGVRAGVAILDVWRLQRKALQHGIHSAFATRSCHTHHSTLSRLGYDRQLEHCSHIKISITIAIALPTAIWVPAVPLRTLKHRRLKQTEHVETRLRPSLPPRLIRCRLQGRRRRRHRPRTARQPAQPLRRRRRHRLG